MNGMIRELFCWFHYIMAYSYFTTDIQNRKILDIDSVYEINDNQNNPVGGRVSRPPDQETSPARSSPQQIGLNGPIMKFNRTGTDLSHFIFGFPENTLIGCGVAPEPPL